MPVTVRPLTDADLTDAWALGRLAFGSDPQPPPTTTTAGLTRYGAFDASGALLGKAVDLHHDQWWTGRAVAAADVAGVAVAPEARGRGVARALLGALLRGAHERGAAVSALFPTVGAPYRACGWEVAGVLRTVDLPTAALPRHRPAAHLTVRSGRTADLPATAALYEQVTRHRCGLLTRRGPLFDHGDELPYDGLTLVEHDGHLVGYAGWQRGRGYGSDSVLTVEDVLATTADASRALVGVLASWHSVAPTLRLTLLPGDAVAAHLPLENAREHEQDTWMHRPVEVTRAVADRGWPPYARGTVTFDLDDPLAEWNTGTWRLDVADGHGELRRWHGETDLRLSVRGFALLYAGAATATAVAEAGLLHPTPGADPRAADLLAAGGPAHLHDYF
ncbi:GNAT family N-acetyltransferase [Micromonospora endolithica]|uniref:GNAT family N-acetyltransferase n=1 Tax=Micromonospora endolithica TaxID=230091 RepID=A0A3A9Z256_9ACTN|nr:GNAT family N-acetyltransferase [Micromonospora endolithica]RKN41427.1 GNAT family N-acetyltransferase [Micromonospora endolithica]TWJ21850.1 putative acetyltransferase [Micromonospora endolithica]